MSSTPLSARILNSFVKTLVLVALTLVAAVTGQTKTTVFESLPPIADGQFAALLLPVSSEAPPPPSISFTSPVIHGELISSYAEKILPLPSGGMVLRRSGHHKSQASFRFHLSPANGVFPAGNYELWTCFTQGGHNAQDFEILAGVAGSHMEPRASFRQSSQSWELQWRKAPASFLISRPEDTVDIRVSGWATQQLNVAGFLLVRVAGLSTGASETEIRELEKPVMDSLGVGNIPLRWLTLGSFAGPAGLSLWGLDYEAQIRPVPGGAEPLLQFDKGGLGYWTESASAADGDVTLDTLSFSCAWPKGSAYAHLWIHAPSARKVVFHVNQTGHGIQGWLNGGNLDWKADAVASVQEVEDTDLNDQGGRMTVRRQTGRSNHSSTLNLAEGWNRLLVKFVSSQRKGEKITFSARFASPSDEKNASLNDVKTAIANPLPSLVLRTLASRFVPTVRTNAPFNLAHADVPLTLDVEIGGVDKFAKKQAPLTDPISSDFILQLIITDYDGREILRKERSDFSVPGKATFDLGPAPARGYYATHIQLLDADRNLVTAYPSDGFSVIGGIAAQEARKEKKKMAVTYYFMAAQEQHKTKYFPYMKRIGIFRNIGGHNTRNELFYRNAAVEGLFVTADLWNHRKPDYVRAYVEETASFVDSYKAFNEVDVHPSQRGTPASWVAKARMDYEIVKQIKPNATVVGASFVRPAADSWFEECLKLGLANYHEVWDVHCYPKQPPVLEGTLSNGPNESELGLQKVYARLGMSNDKPFWIGETGARASHGDDARRWQAEMVAKMTATALSRKDFQKIGFLVPWWYARERGKYLLGDIEAGHMPAEAAYYTASALIDGFDYTRLPLGSDVQAARFGPTIMIWTTNDKTRTITLKPEGKPPFVQVDVVGRMHEQEIDAEGKLQVPVNSSPVYILARADYDRLTAF